MLLKLAQGMHISLFRFGTQNSLNLTSNVWQVDVCNFNLSFSLSYLFLLFSFFTEGHGVVMIVRF